MPKRPILIPVWAGELNEGSPYLPGYVAGDVLAARRLAVALASLGEDVIFFSLAKEDSDEMVDGVRVIHRKNPHQSEFAVWNREEFSRWMLFYLTRYAECVEDICWEFRPRVMLPRPFYPHSPITKVLGDNMGVPTVPTSAGFDYLFFFKKTRKYYLSCGTPTIQACVNESENKHVLEPFKLIAREMKSGFIELLQNQAIVLTKQMACDLSLAVPDHARLHVIPDGVELRCFDKKVMEKDKIRSAWNLKGEVVIGCVSRMDSDKRQDLLVRALSMLGNEDVVLVLGGDGTEKKSLENLAAELGIKDRVRFLGRVAPEKVPSILDACDLIACASEGEGLPLAMLEGMASEKGVIASSVPPFPDFIEEGKTGWLAENSPRGFADAFKRALNEKQRWGMIGSKAKELVSGYTWEKSAQSTLDMLAGICSI